MTDTPSTDPLDTMPPLAPKDATKEQIAVAAYEAVGAMLSALSARADQTRAKNYVAMQFTGCVFPFDRAEIHLIRPDGMSPTERAEDLQLKINILERDTARERKPLTWSEARQLAKASAQRMAANGNAPSYLRDSHMEAWEPHAWVIEAIMEASL
jgi:hypothetical protein